MAAAYFLQESHGVPEEAQLVPWQRFFPPTYPSIRSSGWSSHPPRAARLVFGQGRRNVQPSINFDSRFTRKSNVLSLALLAARLVQNLHSRRGTVRGNLQPVQFLLKF